MSPSPWSIDRLHTLSSTLSHLLSHSTNPDSSTLSTQLLRLDTTLLALRRTPTTPPLLWIDDVFTALQSAHIHLTTPPPPPPPRRSSLRTIFPPSTSQSLSLLSRPSPRTPTKPLLLAATVVSEWVSAIYAARDDTPQLDDLDPYLSLSDLLPPLPHQYAALRDPIYHRARRILRSAILSRTRMPGPTQAVALLGPHGIGKTMLAMELVQDVDLCHSFADGVAWVQLAPAITDEELADQIVRCVETIVAGDFRSTVRYCSSVQSLVSRASRLLRQVSSLVVIDDVSGPHAQRAFDLVISALGPSSVALYTAPVDPHDPHSAEQLSLKHLACVEKLYVQPLEPAGFEALSVFRSWLRMGRTSGEGREGGAIINIPRQKEIVASCHGVPFSIAMAAGFVSKFPADCDALADAVQGSQSVPDTVSRIMGLLLQRGGERFEAQLQAVAALPRAGWVSLSALADLWGVDYRGIKVSARRLGRLAFAEYRLGDSSDDSGVRFHWHIMQYCHRMTSPSDIATAHRKLLANLSRRKATSGKPRLKTDYLPWWGPVVGDKYTIRRLHWHMIRAGAMNRLKELICDFQWICQRLERDGLLSIVSEFQVAIAAEEKHGNEAEALGIQHILIAIQDASKLFKYGGLEVGALPTFLVSRLFEHESTSMCCRQFLTSTHEKARRPWLKPVRAIESALEAAPAEDLSTTSFERDAFTFQTNRLAASSSGKVVCGDKVGNIHVYDPATGKNIISWNSSHVGGHPDGRGVGALATINDYVLSGHLNGRLLLRSISSGEIELIHSSEGMFDKITSLATTENGVVAVGSHTGKLFVLKYVQGFGSVTKRIDLEGHCDVVTSLLVFPDGRRIASSSYNGFAAIWVLRSHGYERISLNGHKQQTGHRENYITTFATIAGGRWLLSSCRGGVITAWNCSNGDCLWTQQYGCEFSSSLPLQSYGIELFSPLRSSSGKPRRILNVGHPYMVTRGEGPKNLLIISTGGACDILASIQTEQIISSWLELWHPATQRIFVAVAYIDGRLASYELVTSLK